jgi:hypothetical protein
VADASGGVLADVGVHDDDRPCHAVFSQFDALRDGIDGQRVRSRGKEYVADRQCAEPVRVSLDDSHDPPPAARLA